LVTSYQPTPQNIGNQLPTYTTKHPRTAKASTTQQQKPEMSHKIKLTTRYKVMLSVDTGLLTFWLPNAIYLGFFKTVHETRDAALYLTPFFPHPTSVGENLAVMRRQVT
jgi:hypothetical protein